MKLEKLKKLMILLSILSSILYAGSSKWAPIQMGDITTFVPYGQNNAIKTLKNVYKPNALVSVKVDAALSGDEDWVGVYHKRAVSNWANEVAWRFIPNNGTFALTDGKKSMPVGNYEARLFFHNNYEEKASYPFVVSNDTFATTKTTYSPNETVSVTVNVPLSGDKDWVGIFPKNADNSWGNVIAWNWVPNKGTTTLSTKIDNKTMPAGEYEVRLFFHNSYDLEKSYGFHVSGIQPAHNKELILMPKGAWAPNMAPNFIKNANYINSLPFSGFVMLGNTYTAEVMKPNTSLSYNTIWNEVKGVKGLYPTKSNFLQVWTDFPGDFWDDTAWNRVKKNFKTLAKVVKNLGFRGIIYDNEPYPRNDEKYRAHKMTNYKHGNEWYDKYAYKNQNHTFAQHSAKITTHFKQIMEAMISEYPSIDVLYLHSPAEGHIKANNGIDGHPVVTNVGLEREHEWEGAMFAGLKKGLSHQATLHDMGEDYRLRTQKHFDDAYRWRKHTIASDATNNAVDATQHWIVPEEERASWAKDVHVDFMVSNEPLEDENNPEFDTRNKVGIADMKKTLERSLEKSDKYVIFFSASSTKNHGPANIHLDWLYPNVHGFSLNPNWKNMVEDVYQNKVLK